MELNEKLEKIKECQNRYWLGSCAFKSYQTIENKSEKVKEFIKYFNQINEKGVKP